ncbi:TetR family transcriptional regulator [Phenylobacterium sp. LjRoot219]|uniref:TetR/AcrR family transcriptional regulator n=1 Tax=Phenylobacterium sp. LjRoot219 TaxID=3342283 RepID=UPI003ED0F885
MDLPSPPRRRNAELTKAQILTAAQKAFSSVGYSQAGIRDIAEMVGVSSTILLRYFGSKAGLFEAALRDILDVGLMIPEERGRFGRRIAGLLAHPQLDYSPHAMIGLSTGDPDARAIATRVLQERALAPLAAWLGAPNAEARATQVITLCTGFVLYSYQLKVLPARERPDPQMVDWLARSLQAIADQSEASS